MSIEQNLKDRSKSKCELCSSSNDLSVYEVPPVNTPSSDNCLLACNTCQEQINKPEKIVGNHWRCLNDSMWSEYPPVQVMAWRILNHLRGEGWAQALLEQLYLEEDNLKWAESFSFAGTEINDSKPTKDSNGTILSKGDTVTLIKDLDVKGANFTAKRGTVVKGIHLTDNPEQIEGKVNGTQIVLLTKFLKKA
jgi:protein PhnA